MMLRIILPPGPMTSRILSTGSDRDDARRVGGTSEREAERLLHLSECASAPWRACSSALVMTSVVMPATLMSICSAVMPAAVPVTLKSMSP